MPRGPRQLAASLQNQLARELRIDAQLPEAIRRPMRGGLITIAVVALAVVALGALQIADAIPDLGNTPMFVYLALIIASAIFWNRMTKRALRHAREVDHLLCPDCTYDLRTLGEMETCPECGEPYQHDAVRERWLDAERRLKPGKSNEASSEPPE